MANLYEVFRDKMILSGNLDVLNVMNELDKVEVKRVNALEKSELQNIIARLDVNEIISAQLTRKLRVLQKRLERTVHTDFGAYLRYLRERNEYSLKSIEQEIGVSISYLNRLRWVNGETSLIHFSQSLRQFSKFPSLKC